jgi:hypothetical protein
MSDSTEATVRMWSAGLRQGIHLVPDSVLLILAGQQEISEWEPGLAAHHGFLVGRGAKVLPPPGCVMIELLSHSLCTVSLKCMIMV